MLDSLQNYECTETEVVNNTLMLKFGEPLNLCSTCSDLPSRQTCLWTNNTSIVSVTLTFTLISDYTLDLTQKTLLCIGYIEHIDLLRHLVVASKIRRCVYAQLKRTGKDEFGFYKCWLFVLNAMRYTKTESNHQPNQISNCLFIWRNNTQEVFCIFI